MLDAVTTRDAGAAQAAPAPRVLLVEDDLVIAREIQAYLGARGVEVSHVTRALSLLAPVGDDDWDAIVLDRMLPDGEGLDVVRRLRGADVATPVLILTARGSIDDRIAGLEAGADDYLVKPFALAELHARIRAIIRARSYVRGETLFHFGALTIDAARHAVTCGDRTVLLQPREARFLLELARHRGEVVPRALLLQQVWNYQFDPRTKVVETLVSRLRMKLLGLHHGDLIASVRGVGYRLNV